MILDIELTEKTFTELFEAISKVLPPAKSTMFGKEIAIARFGLISEGATTRLFSPEEIDPQAWAKIKDVADTVKRRG